MFNPTLTLFWSRGKVVRLVALEKLRIPSPGPKKCQGGQHRSNRLTAFFWYRGGPVRKRGGPVRLKVAGTTLPREGKLENGTSSASSAPLRRWWRGNGARSHENSANIHSVDASLHRWGAHLCRLVPGFLDVGRVTASGGYWLRPSCLWRVRLPHIDSAVHWGDGLVGCGALNQLLAA